MKKYLAVLLLIIGISATCLADEDTNPYIAGQPVAGGSLCSVVSGMENTLENDNSGSSTTTGNYQEVGYSGAGLDICRIDAKIYRFFADISVKIEIWSDVAMTGTKYGESESDVSITEVNPAGTLYQWDITTTTPPTGDFFVHFIQTDVGDGYMRMTYSTDITHYGGSDYTLFWNGANDNRDFTGAIYANQ
jgi:hypothetical protein